MLSIKKIGSFGRKYHHVMRYRQILAIVFKYGFGNIVDALNIEQYIEIGMKLVSRRRSEKIERLSGSRRIRMMFEELGPAFIKFGQILSTRPDLIPVDLLNEFTVLQDKVAPFAFEEVEKILYAEFGKAGDEVFDAFDETPLASASLGQVHRAKLKNGSDVAVKVQRPGIRRIIQVDLEIMHHLAELMETHIEEIAHHRPVRIVEEFAKTLEKELDYTTEASNMERMIRQFKTDETVHIPAVYLEETTEKILTMAYVEGIKISDVDAIEAAGLDKKKITRRGTDFILKQVFDYGFFHADPHPGNIFILDDNVICLLDFGMTGFVNRETRELFVDLLHAVAAGNTRPAVRLLLDLVEYDEKPDTDDLEKAIANFVSKYLARSLKQIRTANMLNDLLEICADNGIRIPPDLFLMIKAFVAVEGIGRRLDPEFNMISHSYPYVKHVKLKRYSPARLKEEAGEVARESMRFVKSLPGDVMDISRLAKQGKMKLNIRIEGLEKILVTHDQTSNRIAFAIVIAALIMGSAQLINSEVPPLVYGVSLIGIVGFAAAAFMGVWLLLAIIKRGRL